MEPCGILMTVSISLAIILTSCVLPTKAWQSHGEPCDPSLDKTSNYTQEDTTKACSFARRLVCDRYKKVCICGHSWVKRQTVWDPNASEDRVNHYKTTYFHQRGKVVRTHLVDGLMGDCRVQKNAGCDPVPCLGGCDCLDRFLCLERKTGKPIKIPKHGSWHSGICQNGTLDPEPETTKKPEPVKVITTTTAWPGPQPVIVPQEEIKTVTVTEVVIWCPETIIFENTTRRLILQHPFIVMIDYEPLTIKGEAFRCTGVIYSSRWIITSYGCALPTIQREQGKPTYKVGIVLYGEIVLQLGDTSELYRHILKAVVPSDVDTGKQTIFDNLDASIALLELNAPLKFSKYTKVIKVAQPDQPLYEAGESAMFSGWRVTEETKEIRVEMRKFTMALLAEEQSTKVFTSKFKLDTRFTALMTTGVDDDVTCNNDMGGALVRIILVDNNQAPVPSAESLLIGVLPVSMCQRVKANVDTEKVEYFTKVSYFNSWITSVAGQQDMDWRKFS